MQPTTRLDRFENPEYDHGPWWKRVAWLVVSAAFFQTWFPWPSAVKAAWLRAFGAEVGRGVVIKPRVTVKYPWRLAVGDHAWIGEWVWLDNLGQISIGPHCCLSQGALLLCGNHDFKRPTFDLMVGDITLEEGVWIGAKASVAPGVCCRSHAVLAMGSTLTRDAEAWSIYQGNPAVKVKDRAMQQD